MMKRKDNCILVERFPLHLTDDVFREGSHASVSELISASEFHLAHHNLKPTPYRWKAKGAAKQIRTEFTDWVWSDGNHPSIVIWDAINENVNNYIGNRLIPELQKLDPTRIWDAGYMMDSDLTGANQMDEPHFYRAGWNLMKQKNPGEWLAENPYPLGKIDDWEPGHLQYLEASAAQLVNEYSWSCLGPVSDQYFDAAGAMTPL